MRYYIADCHFFHGDLLTNMDYRGFSGVGEMNEYMLERWNAKVRPNDEVVILGDLSWGSAEETNEILDRLQGKLYLIEGNHDHFINCKGYRASRFKWIKPYAELHDDGRKVILCHYPVMCYNGQYRLDEEGRPRTYMLYGHVHDTHDQRLIEQFSEITRNTRIVTFSNVERNIPCQMINCFCMYSDYTPLTLDEWIECDRQRMAARKAAAGEDEWKSPESLRS